MGQAFLFQQLPDKIRDSLEKRGLYAVRSVLAFGGMGDSLQGMGTAIYRYFTGASFAGCEGPVAVSAGIYEPAAAVSAVKDADERKRATIGLWTVLEERRCFRSGFCASPASFLLDLFPGFHVDQGDAWIRFGRENPFMAVRPVIFSADMLPAFIGRMARIDGIGEYAGDGAAFPERMRSESPVLFLFIQNAGYFLGTVFSVQGKLINIPYYRRLLRYYGISS